MLDNYAAIFGGAIFANGFRSLSVTGGSTFQDNRASRSGDDFYLSNTVTTFLLQDTSIVNPHATNSLYAQQVTLVVERVTFSNINFAPNSVVGAAIYCFGCRAIDIRRSTFRKLKSEQGGAIHIVDFPTNK